MRRYTITVNDVSKVIDVEALTADTYRVSVGGRTVTVRLDDHRSLTPAVVPGSDLRAPLPPAPAPPGTKVQVSPGPAVGPDAAASGTESDRLTAPMPGRIVKVCTVVGARVGRGETLLVLEAMKMRNDLKAARDGVVAEIYVTDGQQVRYGEHLLRLEDR